MWVVTRAENDSNQYGEYFVGVYTHKPTIENLKKLLPNKSEQTIKHILNGGGRQDFEDTWYFLSEINDGEKYEHS